MTTKNAITSNTNAFSIIASLFPNVNLMDIESDDLKTAVMIAAEYSTLSKSSIAAHINMVKMAVNGKNVKYDSPSMGYHYSVYAAAAWNVGLIDDDQFKSANVNCHKSSIAEGSSNVINNAHQYFDIDQYMTITQDVEGKQYHWSFADLAATMDW